MLLQAWFLGCLGRNLSGRWGHSQVGQCLCFGRVAPPQVQGAQKWGPRVPSAQMLHFGTKQKLKNDLMGVGQVRFGCNNISTLPKGLALVRTLALQWALALQQALALQRAGTLKANMEFATGGVSGLDPIFLPRFSTNKGSYDLPLDTWGEVFPWFFLNFRLYSCQEQLSHNFLDFNHTWFWWMFGSFVHNYFKTNCI